MFWTRGRAAQLPNSGSIPPPRDPLAEACTGGASGGDRRFAGSAQREDGLHKVLVVTDRGVLRAGLVNRIYKELERAGVAVEVFSDVHANPTIPDILGGLRRYRALTARV